MLWTVLMMVWMALPPPTFASFLNAEGDLPFKTIADLDAYVDSLVADARVQMSKGFSEEIHRYRRDLDIDTVNVLGVEPYDFNFIRAAEFGTSVLEKATGLHVFSTQEEFYWIFGNLRNESQVIVEVSKADNRVVNMTRFQVTSKELDRVEHMAIQIYGDYLWMAFGSATSAMVTISCVNLKTGQDQGLQNIPVEVKLGRLHMFKALGKLYLVVGKNSDQSGTPADSCIYVLMEKYFDRVENMRFRTRGVQDIAGFANGGRYYLIFGMQHSAGSQLYEFDTSFDSMKLIQEIPDTDVLRVLHYIDYHDEKHYVLTLNNGGMPKIYWWDREQLLEWQILKSEPLKPGAWIEVLTLDTFEMIIMIANEGRITFYTDDLTAHYYPHFSFDTNCATVKDLSATRINQAYVLSYICQDEKGVSISVEGKLLQLKSVELAPSEEEADPLLKCLIHLGDDLLERKANISYLKEVVDNDSIMTNDRPQTWTGPITFSSGLNVSGSTNFMSSVTLKAQDDLLNVSSDISLLESEVQKLESGLENVLYHSEEQTITGPVRTDHLNVERLEVSSIEIDKLNGIPLENLHRDYLIIGFDQTINSRVYVENLSTASLTTRSKSPPATINGIESSNFMRRSVADQEVTGHHTYSHIITNVITSRDGGPIRINGMSSKDIVTRGSDPIFKDRKFLNKLSITGPLNLKFLNGVDFRNLVEQAVYTDVTSLQSLRGNYSFKNITVDGNVDVDAINGVDLPALDAVSVKTTGNFILEGPVTYESLIITGDLSCNVVNGVLWKDIVDKETPGLLVGDYHFVHAHIESALRSDNINGLDLSEDAVLIDTDQTIFGRITFNSDVKVTGDAGVEMQEGGTINNVDPSRLFNIASNHRNVLVVEEVANLSVPLAIPGNVNATKINGLDLEGIESRYWRRSVDQDIEVSVHINEAEFQNPVTGRSINGNQMTDFLNVNENQVISGSYIFQNTVQLTGDLDMSPNKTVDGVDVSELKRSVVTLSGDQTIEGDTECLHKFVVNGDLNVTGTLNGLDVTSDLMMLDRPNIHTGNLNFSGLIEAENLILTSGDLLVESLNGHDIAAVAANIVRNDTDSKIVGGFGLQFVDLSVNELVVDGLVDGVNISDMIERSLKKWSSETQYVSAQLTANNVHFDHTLSLGLANGKNWTTHLNNVIPLDYSGRISGAKTFAQSLHVTGDFNPKTINNISVSDLASSIFTKSQDQYVVGYFTFGNITASDVSSPLINGVDPRKLLLVDEPASLRGTVTFAQNVTFQGGIDAATNILDGCDLKKFDQDNGNEHDGSLHFYNPVNMRNLNVEGAVSVQGSVLVGSGDQRFDLEEFLQALVLKSTDENISGDTSFLSEVSISDLLARSINGVDVDELYDFSIMDNEDVVLDCSIQFAQPLTVGTLNVTSAVSGFDSNGVLVNNIDVSHLEEQAVRDDAGTNFISGKKTLTQSFSAENLNVIGAIGGVPVTKFATLSRSEDIKTIQFNAPITVGGDLLVGGLIDGVNLTHVLANRITLNDSQVISGSCTFEAIRVEGDLEVDEINDVKLSDLIVKSGKETQVITGDKMFAGGLHVNGEIDARLVNGVDVQELNRTIVRKNENATIEGPVVFENLVRYHSNETDQSDTLYSPIDEEELHQSISLMAQFLEEEYEYIKNRQAELYDLNQENYENAKYMFQQLSYLEKEDFVDAASFGKLWFGNNPYEEGHGLAVRQGGSGCSETVVYQVDEDGNVNTDDAVNEDGTLFIVRHPQSDLQVSLTVRCGEPASTEVAVKRIDAPRNEVLFKEQMSLGLVVDAVLFTDGGIDYIATASRLSEPKNLTEVTLFTTLRINIENKSLDIIQVEKTRNSAANMDLALVNGVWHLLIANHMGADDQVDPYTAASQLYVWQTSITQFELKGEYVADHVTSGMFLQSSSPVEENFFTLAQLKDANRAEEEDNVHYNTKVLVFRYSRETDKFQAFESLPTLGVIGQATITIDENLYLLLLSRVKGTLDVYEYIHLEGFQLYQQITVREPHDLVVMKTKKGTFIAVSILSPRGILKLQVKTKGINPDELLLQ